ncbi:MAG: glycerol-3-phosphate acyltransferase [Coriobacteriia bacterium]
MDRVGINLFAWALAFLSGSLPFAVWLGKLIARKDVRDFGSGNPGAAGAFRMGGPPLGVLVLAFDVTKGVLPVALAEETLGISGWALVPVAVLPVAGHVFSPFLGFKGGKGLATTLGVWIALTSWRVPAVVLAVIVVVTLLIAPDVWGVLAAFFALGITIALWMPDWPLGAIALLQAAVIAPRFRTQFAERPHLRFAERRAR